MYCETMTIHGMLTDLHNLHHNATAGVPGANDFLVKAGLARVNRRTGWYDATPTGRAVIAASIRDDTIECVWNLGQCEEQARKRYADLSA